MKISSSVFNMTQLKSVKTFADFQVWIQGVKNNSGELDYIQLVHIDQIRQERLLETVLRLSNKTHDIEIIPIFPEEMMDQIASSIINPNARTFIPVIGIKMICGSTSNWSRIRNNVKHDIVTIDLIKRKPKPLEIELMRGELDALLSDMLF